MKWTALAIVVSGLFPPWMYTFENTGAGADSLLDVLSRGHWEVSAGYAPIFKPPRTDLNVSSWSLEEYRLMFGARAGIRLDTTRLLVQWVCILTVGGAAWAVARLKSEASQKAESGIV